LHNFIAFALEYVGWSRKIYLTKIKDFDSIDSWWPAKLLSPDHVDVQMEDGLAAVLTLIDH
jgi:hypothetical protein